MPSNANRQFLDFEKPIKDLIETIEKYKHDSEKNKMDMSEPIRQLEESILQKRKEITQHLTSWQRVQLSRHPDRPYTMKYIDKMTSCFLELYGDRNVKDDKAMIGGFANLDGETVMLVGQQKGINTKMRQMRNFGMANPEGYRKALRLMKLAEKFNKPVITLIDTPGAFPGSGIIPSINPKFNMWSAVSRSCSAATSFLSQLRQRMDEQLSGLITVYHVFSII